MVRLASIEEPALGIRSGDVVPGGQQVPRVSDDSGCVRVTLHSDQNCGGVIASPVQ